MKSQGRFFALIVSIFIYGLLMDCALTLGTLSEIPSGREKRKRIVKRPISLAEKDGKFFIQFDYRKTESDSFLHSEYVEKGCAKVLDRSTDAPIKIPILFGRDCDALKASNRFQELDDTQAVLSVGDSHVFDIPGLKISYHCVCKDFPKEKKIRYILYTSAPEITQVGDHFLIVFEDGSAFGISRDLYHKSVGSVSKADLESYLSSRFCDYVNCNLFDKIPYRASAYYYSQTNATESSFLGVDEGILSIYSEEDTFQDTKSKSIFRSAFLFKRKDLPFENRFLSAKLEASIEEYKGRMKPEKVLLLPLTLVGDLLSFPIQLVFFSVFVFGGK